MNRRILIIVSGAVLGLSPAAGAEESGNFLMIRRDQPVQRVEIAEIGTRSIVYRQQESASWTTVSRERCVALLRTDAVIVLRRHGWLRLADGQQFPGEALSNAPPEADSLAWNQLTWLGRLVVPLDRIESVTFDPDAVVPPAGEGDVIVFSNGDRADAIVMTLGDPVTFEMLEPDPAAQDIVEQPLDHVAAVRMITPPQDPKGRRLWLVDGTVFDVNELLLGDDGMFRLDGLPFSEDETQRIEMEAVAAVLFDASALQPFGELRPRRVQGPPTRYSVPAPRPLDDRAALDLSRVEFRGPLTAHYVLPPGATYFSAEAHLPAVDRTWGDCEIIVRVDGHPVFTARLSAAQPTVFIGVELHGSLLTVEITEGTAGPIQDRVILSRGMVLVE